MLEVPQITDYTSESGNNYVRERSLDFIAESLMKPADAEHDDSEVSSEEEAEPEPEPIKQVESNKALNKSGVDSKAALKPGQKSNASKAPEPEPEIESSEAEEEVEMIPAFEANDYMVKAEMLPPQDPDAN